MRPALVSFDTVHGLLRVYRGKQKIDAATITDWAGTALQDRGLDPASVEVWRASYDKPVPPAGPGTPDGTRTAIAA